MSTLAFSHSAVEVRWFDPASGKNEVASAPAVVVQVATAAAFKPAIAPPKQAAEPSAALHWLRYGALAVAAMVLLAAIVWIAARLWSRLSAWRTARRDKREHSEASYFKRFEQACRTGDGLAIYASLDSWSRRAEVSPLSAWLQRIGEPSAQREYASFEGAVFGAGSRGTWNPRLLAEGMSRARMAWLRHRASSIASPPALPELNP